MRKGVSKFKLYNKSRDTSAYARNIDRTFLRSTLKAIQLSVLHYIFIIIAIDDINIDEININFLKLIFLIIIVEVLFNKLRLISLLFFIILNLIIKLIFIIIINLIINNVIFIICLINNDLIIINIL